MSIGLLMVRYILIAGLCLFALTGCAAETEENTTTEADKIAAGVAATLEARRIESAISATLEAIATSTPVPTQGAEVVVVVNRPDEEYSWDLMATRVGTHKTATPDPSLANLESEALVRLFEATGGSSWNLSDNWLSDRPVGEWFGVTTDSDGRVTELRLRYNILKGELPPELGNLTELQVLSLGGTGLSGEIPREVGNLTNLVELWLWGNELSGEIPPELGNLANLEVLDLNGNMLEGEIPPELGALSGLKQLRLWENELSGEIPPELGNLTSLESLGLSWNQLSGEIPPELGRLTNLVWLDLSRNQLAGEIPMEFGNLSNLDELYLFGNLLSGCLPASLQDQLIHEVELAFCSPATQ